MKVLSLFDGMSCGQIALKELGVHVEKYYAAEIDKHAIATAKHNFPDMVHLGDVTKWQEWDIDWSQIGLLLGGSPCQGFSFAGKQLAFDDPRSALFFVFVDIWHHIKRHNPNAYFLLENVRMKQSHEAVITQYMEVHPIMINSALVSAQNRVRLYWTNIANEPYGMFNDMKCTIPQPEDRGILLRDVLENEVDEKYFLSEKMLNYFIQNTEKMQEQGNGFKFEPTQGDNKAKCITTKEGGRMENNFIVAMRGRNPDNPKSREVGLPTEQMLEPRHDGKTNCLTTVGKDNLVITHSLQPRNGKGQGGKGHLFKTDQKSYCVDTGNGQAVEYTDRIRRLTPTECARLQTIPEWYDMTVASDTQRYRMLGNGWTVEVIKHILSYI